MKWHQRMSNKILCQVSMYVNRTKRPTNCYCLFSTDVTSTKLVYKHKSVHPPLSLRKHPTFRDVSTDCPQKWCLGKNTNLAMTANEEFASTNHGMECFNQHKIFALIPQTSFRGESSGGFAKCKLFSQVSKLYEKWPQILPNTIALSWGSKPVTGIKRSVTQKQPSLLLLFSRLYSEKSLTFKKVLLVNKKKIIAFWRRNLYLERLN